jgi:hypothetical protein
MCVRKSSIVQDQTASTKFHRNIEESILNVDATPHLIISMGQPAPYVPETVDDQHVVKSSQKAAPDVFDNNEDLQNLNQDDLGGCCSGWKGVLFYVVSYLGMLLPK